MHRRALAGGGAAERHLPGRLSVKQHHPPITAEISRARPATAQPARVPSTLPGPDTRSGLPGGASAGPGTHPRSHAPCRQPGRRSRRASGRRRAPAGAGSLRLSLSRPCPACLTRSAAAGGRCRRPGGAPCCLGWPRRGRPARGGGARVRALFGCADHQASTQLKFHTSLDPGPGERHAAVHVSTATVGRGRSREDVCSRQLVGGPSGCRHRRK